MDQKGKGVAVRGKSTHKDTEVIKSLGNVSKVWGWGRRKPGWRSR